MPPGRNNENGWDGLEGDFPRDGSRLEGRSNGQRVARARMLDRMLSADFDFIVHIPRNYFDNSAGLPSSLLGAGKRNRLLQGETQRVKTGADKPN